MALCLLKRTLKTMLLQHYIYKKKCQMVESLVPEGLMWSGADGIRIHALGPGLQTTYKGDVSLLQEQTESINYCH